MNEHEDHETTLIPPEVGYGTIFLIFPKYYIASISLIFTYHPLRWTFQARYPITDDQYEAWFGTNLGVRRPYKWIKDYHRLYLFNPANHKKMGNLMLGSGVILGWIIGAFLVLPLLN